MFLKRAKRGCLEKTVVFRLGTKPNHHLAQRWVVMRTLQCPLRDSRPLLPLLPLPHPLPWIMVGWD